MLRISGLTGFEMIRPPSRPAKGSIAPKPKTGLAGVGSIKLLGALVNDSYRFRSKDRYHPQTLEYA